MQDVSGLCYQGRGEGQLPRLLMEYKLLPTLRGVCLAVVWEICKKYVYKPVILETCKFYIGTEMCLLQPCL